MQMDHPSFCKYLCTQGFADRIQIPSDFMKENKNMLAKTCLLKTEIEAGRPMLWQAKIVRDKSNNNFFICEGDWPQFVVYHKLELGDILLFFLIDNYTFLVVPYFPKRQHLIFEQLSCSSDEEQDVEAGDGSKDSVDISKIGQGTVDSLIEIPSSVEHIQENEDKMEQTLKVQEKTKDPRIAQLEAKLIRTESTVSMEIRKKTRDIMAANVAMKVAEANVGILERKIEVCRLTWECAHNNFLISIDSAQLDLKVAHDEIVAANENLSMAKAAAIEAERLYELQKNHTHHVLGEEPTT